jgi:hypothetical protein
MLSMQFTLLLGCLRELLVLFVNFVVVIALGLLLKLLALELVKVQGGLFFGGKFVISLSLRHYL